MSKKPVDQQLFEMISAIVDNSFDSHYNKVQEKPVETYESIEDYTAKTGKRFRMLKEQKERGLSREEAFREMFPKPE